MKKFNLLLMALLVFALVSCGDSDSPNNNTDPDPSGNDKVIKLNSAYITYGNPIVDNDDNVYMLATDGALNTNVVVICIGADNKVTWEKALTGYVSELVMNGDNIYAASNETLYSLNKADGTIAWEIEIGTPNTLQSTKYAHKPCIDAAGNIIVALDGELFPDYQTGVPAKIMSISPAGTLLWEKEFTSNDEYMDIHSKLSSPIISNGNIYLTIEGDDYPSFLCYSLQGTMQYAVTMSDYYRNLKFVAADNAGDVYYTYYDDNTNGNRLVHADAGLSQKWNVEFTGNIVVENIVIDATGNLYLAVNDGYIYKINGNSGDEIWKLDVGIAFSTGELLLADDGNLYRLHQGPERINTETGTIDKSLDFASMVVTDICMRSDGTIVAGSIGNVYYVETGATGLDRAAQWAKNGADQFNRSRK
jgi:outer membrane protein assembly factor BamB